MKFLKIFYWKIKELLEFLLDFFQVVFVTFNIITLEMFKRNISVKPI